MKNEPKAAQKPDYTVAIQAVTLPGVNRKFEVGTKHNDRVVGHISLSNAPGGQSAYDVLDENRFPIAVVTAGIGPLIVDLAEPVKVEEGKVSTLPEDCTNYKEGVCVDSSNCSNYEYCTEHPKFSKKGVEGSEYCQDMCKEDDCNECQAPADPCTGEAGCNA